MPTHDVRAFGGGYGPSCHACVAARPPRSAVQSLAHAIRSSVALSSGVDIAMAAPPAGDTVIFASVPQTIESAYGALSAYLALDKITPLGLAKVTYWRGSTIRE